MNYLVNWFSNTHFGENTIGEIQGLLWLLLYIYTAVIIYKLGKRYEYVKEIRVVIKLIPFITIPLFLIRFIEIVTHNKILEPTFQYLNLR